MSSQRGRDTQTHTHLCYSFALMCVCVCCSDAIMKYLCNRYDVPEHWYPRQPERRARVDEYTAWHHTNTRPHAARVFILEVRLSLSLSLSPPACLTLQPFVSQVLLPSQTGSPVDEARLIRAVSQLEDTLDQLESMFLGRQPFLCGDDISVADLLAVCELMQVRGRDWSRC